jgi:hypothetical protein
MSTQTPNASLASVGNRISETHLPAFLVEELKFENKINSYIISVVAELGGIASYNEILIKLYRTKSKTRLKRGALAIRASKMVKDGKMIRPAESTLAMPDWVDPTTETTTTETATVVTMSPKQPSPKQPTATDPMPDSF